MNKNISHIFSMHGCYEPLFPLTMHYIRFLRPPAISKPSGKGAGSLTLVFTITTDLGDSFLSPEDPISLDMSISTRLRGGPAEEIPFIIQPKQSRTDEAVWTSGMRVFKQDLFLHAARDLFEQERRTRVIIDLKPASQYKGCILGVVAELAPAGASGSQVSTRELPLCQYNSWDDEASLLLLEAEEDIGESIARHIWDAGIASLRALSVACNPRGLVNMSSPSDLTDKLRQILTAKDFINVIELGCGVGILGVGLSMLLIAGKSTEKFTFESGYQILLTDLPEAEERARANIARNKVKLADEPRAKAVAIDYENLDWEDGRNGAFGEEAQARTWDLVMLSDCTYNVDVLPALVGTLSALHEANATRHTAAPASGQPPATHVLLATKPRHESEKLLFGLMKDHGWSIYSQHILPLPVADNEPESVEMYLFRKG
jgi:hypothetical protein